MKRNKFKYGLTINFSAVFLAFALIFSYLPNSFAAPDSEEAQSQETEEAPTIKIVELPEEESASASFTRKATIQALNKITARTQTLDITVGKKTSVGKLDILLHKCWQSPSHQAPENKMLIEIFNHSSGKKERIFFGWIFSSSPSISGLEHPIYDITAIKCFN